MVAVDEMKEIIKDIIASYEDRISTVRMIIETTHRMLEKYRENMRRTEEEREKINARLQETLARGEHLRRKDFDRMMEEISWGINKRKKEIEEKQNLIREKLREYFDEQKNTATTLRKKLSTFTDDLKKNESARIKDFKLLLKGIQIQQEKRGDEVRGMLKGFREKLKIFRREQEQMAQTLRDLLSKGDSLRIRDFKATLAELQAQKRERKTSWEEERKKTREILHDFHGERRKVISDLEKAGTYWQDLASTMEERRIKRGGRSQDSKNKSISKRGIKNGNSRRDEKSR